ncbi:MAG TPA: glycosyltransferase family 39 protein [Bryobacteraceae bacterium]|nr:glycosyltransferase family 39 protein [Bryobacteraceae bacterium]
MNKFRPGIAITFVALFLLFAIVSLAWLRLNKAPPNWDDAWYLANSLRLYDAWTDGGIIGAAGQFLASLSFKAPLITALPLPFYWLAGRHWQAAFLVNIGAMLVLFAAVWAIGSRLRGPRTGLMAVYICGTLPLLYGLSRWYLVEYPLAAAVAVAFWLVLVAAADERTVATFAFGMVCGLGLLLKADFPLFVGPMAVLLLLRRRDRGRTLLAILAPAFLLAAPWYVLHWRATLENAISAGFGASAVIQGTGEIFSLSALSKYLGIVVDRGISEYYLAVVVLAAAIALQRRSKVFRESACLLLWLTPFLVFAFGGNKDVRYIAPILPGFALGAACLLDCATENRRWIGVVVLAFPLISLLAVSFGWPYAASDAGYAIHFSPNPWRQDEILTVIAENARFPHAGQKMLLLGTDRGFFNADNFQLCALQERLPLRVETTAYGRSLKDLLGQTNGADYSVYKEGGEAESRFFNTEAADLPRLLRESTEWVETPFGRALPDGGTAHILQRRLEGRTVLLP